MSALLPALLAIPIAFVLLFESDVLGNCKSHVELDDEDNNRPRSARVIIYMRNKATKLLETGATPRERESLQSALATIRRRATIRATDVSARIQARLIASSRGQSVAASDSISGRGEVHA
eukprot:2585839-Prymnesium_polylepis.1